MKVLVTGGAGYLGGKVVDYLNEAGHDVCVYDILLYEESYRKPTRFIYGDVRDTARLQSWLDWADVVVWLSALVGDQACALNKVYTKEVNADSVKFLRSSFKGKIIFTSTCSVYGFNDNIVTEKSPLAPLSFYAESKVMAENILASSNALIFRLGTLFGMGDEYSRIRTDLVLNTLTMHAFGTGKISIFGGEQYRPMIHLRDVAKVISASVDSSLSGIYNLHYDNYKMLQLADIVESEFKNLKVDVISTKFEDNRNYKASSEKARCEIVFNPSIEPIVGVHELRILLEQHRITSPYSSRYSNCDHLITQLGGKN